MQTQEELARQIASEIRQQQGLGGFFRETSLIANRMMENKLSLGVTCAKCSSQDVYCCATTHGKGKEVACICVHICFGCGENMPAADFIWRATANETVRCFHCSRVVPVFTG